MEGLGIGEAALWCMKPIAYAFSVLPGETEKAREFVKSLETKHAKEFAALEKKLKTTRESVFL
jgi:hypothetical protein